MLVDLQYCVIFGKLDSSDWIEWSIELTEEEEAIYKEAVAKGLDLNKVEGLKPVLDRAYDEIEDEEISNGIDNEDEFVMQCQGIGTVDPDELNDLVHAHDEHALEYFDLTDLDDEEIEDWDAEDLEELPDIADFYDDFESESPFDNGWILRVEFPEE